MTRDGIRENDAAARPAEKKAGRALSLLLILISPLAVLAALRFGPSPVAIEAGRPLTHRLDGYVGSPRCAACHPDHDLSWKRTFHRTMTQRPSDEMIQGRFDGRSVRYANDSARAYRDGGRFLMEIPGKNGQRRTAEVALAVGSHRYQQYFEKVESADGTAYRRLPMLWHNGEKRWLPMNTVFLGVDDAQWSNHDAVWNSNCIFCHNTGPRPGLVGDPKTARGDHLAFDSKTAELGIGCEACHGPGEAHAEKHAHPLERLAAYGTPDTTIVDPLKQDGARAAAICGQCHGQRLPNPRERIDAWMVTGPSFRPGQLLTDHVRPVTKDEPTLDRNDPALFAKRFWPDGTARLSAYEYQGYLASPCAKDKRFTCTTCHTMHGGDPAGMIEPAMKTKAACAECHAAITNDPSAHTRHAPESAGSDCYACHMPRIIYGLLGIHRSHVIESPAPAKRAAIGRPDACTLCHLDRSAAWAERDILAHRKGTAAAPEASAPPAVGEAIHSSEALSSLLTGDVVMRAVFARAFGRTDAKVDPSFEATRRAALIAMLGDAYPAVRFLAKESLLALEAKSPIGLAAPLLEWDTIDFDGRAAIVATLFDVLAREGPKHLAAPPPGGIVRPDFSIDIKVLAALLNRQPDVAISIGE